MFGSVGLGQLEAADGTGAAVEVVRAEGQDPPVRLTARDPHVALGPVGHGQDRDPLVAVLHRRVDDVAGAELAQARPR